MLVGKNYRELESQTGLNMAFCKDKPHHRAQTLRTLQS